MAVREEAGLSFLANDLWKVVVLAWPVWSGQREEAWGEGVGP